MIIAGMEKKARTEKVLAKSVGFLYDKVYAIMYKERKRCKQWLDAHLKAESTRRMENP